MAERIAKMTKQEEKKKIEKIEKDDLEWSICRKNKRYLDEERMESREQRESLRRAKLLEEEENRKKELKIKDEKEREMKRERARIQQVKSHREASSYPYTMITILTLLP